MGSVDRQVVWVTIVGNICRAKGENQDHSYVHEVGAACRFLFSSGLAGTRL